MKEDKLIKSLIPKISEYFNENQYLKKDNLSKFLDYIDLTIWNSETEKEVLWAALMKNCSSEKELQKVILIKNLTNFIHGHSQSLFQPEKSLESSVKNYLSSMQPYYSNELSDSNYEAQYELYKLLALIQFNLNKNTTLFELEELLQQNKFIKLDKETMVSLLNEFSEENVTEIKMPLYFDLMEKFAKKFRFRQNEIMEKVFTFDDEDLNEAEHSDFSYITEYLKILSRLRDSLFLINKKLHETKNQQGENEFYSRYWNIMLENIQVYCNEIELVYLEQKQKFDYFNDKINGKINFLNSEKEDLEKKLNEKSSSVVVEDKETSEKIINEINSLKAANDELSIELKGLKKELSKKEEELITSNNKIIQYDKENEELQGKYNTLSKENEILNQNYTKLLNDFNSKVFNKKDNEIQDSIGDKLKLNEEQKNLVNLYHGELVSYIIEKDKYYNSLDETNKKLKEDLSQNNREKEAMKAEISELKVKTLTLSQKNDELQSSIDELNKDIEMYKPNKLNALSSLIQEDEEPRKRKGKLISNPISLFIQGKKVPKKVEPKRVSFDYLCLKFDEVIISCLDDQYYKPSNLVFTERINFMDESKKFIPCILFISQSFMYILNKETYEKCFSAPLIYLTTINASTNNNLISLSFFTGEILIFEIFRVLEFINFFKALNAYEKGNNYSINISKFNNQFLPSKKTAKNYTNTPYYGKAILSGYLIKRSEGVLGKTYNEKFCVLTDIGLVVMDDPLGKPSEIINLLFCEQSEYEDKDGNYCLEIVVGKNVHMFIAKSMIIRQNWKTNIDNWILSTYNDQVISL